MIDWHRLASAAGVSGVQVD